MRLRNALALAGIAAALVVAFVLVNLTGECGGNASCPSTARVDGRTYLLSIARCMDVQPTDLVRYATVTRRSPGHVTLDEDAYRLGDIDPTRVLVMKLAPGQADGAGPIGDYLLLVTDASDWALTCPFYRSGDPFRPEGCT